MDISYWTTPRDLFTHGAASPLQRIARRDNPEKEILLYASGQFIDENKKKGNPRRAGCAVVFSYDIHQRAHFTKFLLEQHGPEGVRHDLNQKTAELRAVVAALELKAWRTEGWEKVTIATTSLYVHSGITKSIALWGAEGWLKGATHNGSQLQNSDLWARALALVNEQASRGCEVQFWLIKPAEAKDVVAAALMAAENQQTPTFYKSIGDMLSIPTPATSIAVTLTAASLCDAEKKRRKKEKKQRRASEKLRLKLAK
jgi:ribonuclease HI